MGRRKRRIKNRITRRRRTLGEVEQDVENRRRRMRTGGGEGEQEDGK